MTRGDFMCGILIDVCNGTNEKAKMNIEDVVGYKLNSLMLKEYDIEVLKALAVLERSQLCKYIKNSCYSKYNEEDIIIDKMDSLDNDSVIRKAVQETRGYIAVNRDKAVDLYYTECCGGGTANSEDVLGCQLSYLRKVLCKFCSENYTEKVIQVNEIAMKVNTRIPTYKGEVGSIIRDVIRDETGRIISINILGRKMSGEEFMKLFGIESNRVYFIEDSVVMKVIGRGLGLGICLEGADNMARQGQNYEDIIKYYYTGVELKHLDENSISKHLTGKKIVIDPGHGGSDKGNECRGIYEKDVNLKIANNLKEMLEEIKACVVLTRNSDRDLSLGERVRIINSERPDFYISIHQNSFMSKSVNGVEVYCYYKDDAAQKLGNIICSTVSEEVNLTRRGVRTGDYYLLREAKVSGIILECMYMSGDYDSLKYNDENYLRIAGSIFKSICSYYNIEP